MIGRSATVRCRQCAEDGIGTMRKPRSAGRFHSLMLLVWLVSSRRTTFKTSRRIDEKCSAPLSRRVRLASSEKRPGLLSGEDVVDLLVG